jgi:hypothetical protein
LRIVSRFPARQFRGIFTILKHAELIAKRRDGNRILGADI